MTMVVRMIVAVIVTAMRVIMMTMGVIMTVIVAMMVIVRRLRRIGAAFRLKRCFDQRDLGAERGEQSLDRVIAPRADTVRQQLDRDMAVAEMPGQTSQTGHIGQARLDQRLGRRDDFDQTAVVEHQQVVGAQARRAVQMDVDSVAFDACRGRRLAAALGIIEDHGIGDRSPVAMVSGDDARSARHDGQDFRLSVQAFRAVARRLGAGFRSGPIDRQMRAAGIRSGSR